MDQVIDEPDECVLSTDQLTLMRLWLLQAKYFPLLFSPPLPCLSSPLLFLFPHIMRWKSLVVILVAGSSTCILQNGEIFTLRDWGGGWGGGDDSAQFVSLWRAVTFLFLSWPNKAKTHVRRWIYMQKNTDTHINAVDAVIAAVPEGRSSSSRLWPSFGSRTDGWAEVPSSSPLIVSLTSLLLCDFCGSWSGSLRALSVGKPR